MVELTPEEKHLLKFWFLSCEDFSLICENWKCSNCHFKIECKELRKKLFGETK